MGVGTLSKTTFSSVLFARNLCMEAGTLLATVAINSYIWNAVKYSSATSPRGLFVRPHKQSNLTVSDRCVKATSCNRWVLGLFKNRQEREGVV